MTVLTFLYYIGVSESNLTFIWYSLTSSMVRLNCKLEWDKDLSPKQYYHLIRLLTKIELQCTIVEDVTENIELIRGFGVDI